MALEEMQLHGGRQEDRVIVEDEAGSPAVAMDKARKLVETDKVCLFLGPFHGGAVAALAGYADQGPDSSSRHVVQHSRRPDVEHAMDVGTDRITGDDLRSFRRLCL